MDNILVPASPPQLSRKRLRDDAHCDDDDTDCVESDSVEVASMRDVVALWRSPDDNRIKRLPLDILSVLTPYVPLPLERHSVPSCQYRWAPCCNTWKVCVVCLRRYDGSQRRLRGRDIKHALPPLDADRHCSLGRLEDTCYKCFMTAREASLTRICSCCGACTSLARKCPCCGGGGTRCAWCPHGFGYF